MVRGPRHHLKRLAAPKHWMLDKMGGVYAPKPSTGPHKLRECLPLILLLRNRLKYALTRREVTSIVAQRLIKIDGKVRTDARYPTGFMDVVTIDKTNEHMRMLYDEKGRFTAHRITPEEARYKLCRVTKVRMGPNNIPYLVTNDSRTIRYPRPGIRSNDTVKVDIASGKIAGHVRFEIGNLAMATGGRNVGRIGVIVRREKHPGSFELVHVKDAVGHRFSTRLSNIFVIGKGTRSLVSLPRGKGVKLSIIEERAARVTRRAAIEASRSRKKAANAKKAKQAKKSTTTKGAVKKTTTTTTTTTNTTNKKKAAAGKTGGKKGATAKPQQQQKTVPAKKK